MNLAPIVAWMRGTGEQSPAHEEWQHASYIIESVNLKHNGGLDMAERSLSEILVDIAQARLLVNNMFQLDTGQWQVNLRTPVRPETPQNTCYEFGRGSTLVEAAREAFRNAQTKPGVPGGKITGTYVPRRASEPDSAEPPPRITFEMLFEKKG